MNKVFSKELESFLREKDLLKQATKNAERYPFPVVLPPYNNLFDAFMWEPTPEKFLFWMEVQREYTEKFLDL